MLADRRVLILISVAQVMSVAEAPVKTAAVFFIPRFVRRTVVLQQHRNVMNLVTEDRQPGIVVPAGKSVQIWMLIMLGYVD